MTIEWSTRLERSTTIANVVATLSETADRLLWPGAGRTIAVTAEAGEGQCDLTEVLSMPQNPDDAEAPTASVILSALERAQVSLTFTSFGVRADDPECGRFAYVECGRTREGIALGVCCVIAVAACGGGLVWDENHAFGPTRFHAPDSLAATLTPARPSTAPTAVDRLLSSTSYADFGQD